nr:hypothetical protein [Tanacetum cinerariifolium]
GSPSSTTVDQDAPSPSKSLTPTEIQFSVILQDVGNDNLDMEVAHMGNDPLLGVPIPEVTSEQSSLMASPQSNVQPNHPMTHHNSKWTKDHPLNNIIGLQISQHPRGIFINQSKYALESLKKYGFEFCDPADTPMVEKSKPDEDKEGKAVDPSHYRGSATKKHVHTVKRIFRYLRGTVHRGLWYLKGSSVALTTFADVDHAGCQDIRRSTSGSVQFLGERLISWSSKR